MSHRSFMGLVLIVAAAPLVYFHGPFGFVLAIPHISTVALGSWLVRRAKCTIAAITVFAYLACWVATWILGVQSVSTEFRARIKGIRNEYLNDPGELRRLEHDPIMDDTAPGVPAPWHYVGNETVPCPLVIAVDYGFKVHPSSGCGGRSYMFWAFGYHRQIHNRWHWFS